MRFTKKQYQTAMQSLKDASEQLEPDGRNCTCCGDSGHQAFECGFNPLVAMAICKQLAEDARTADAKYLSQESIILYLSGQEFRMGEVIGPAKIRLPEST